MSCTESPNAFPMGADSDHQHTKPTEEETFCSHSTSSPEQGMIMQPSEPAGMLYFIQYGFMGGGGGGGGEGWLGLSGLYV